MQQVVYTQLSMVAVRVDSMVYSRHARWLLDYYSPIVPSTDSVLNIDIGRNPTLWYRWYVNVHEGRFDSDLDEKQWSILRLFLFDRRSYSIRARCAKVADWKWTVKEVSDCHWVIRTRRRRCCLPSSSVESFLRAMFWACPTLKSRYRSIVHCSSLIFQWMLLTATNDQFLFETDG